MKTNQTWRRTMKVIKSLENHQDVLLELEGETSHKTGFTHQISALLAQGYIHFVVDLKTECKVDAAGLGVLIAAWKTIHTAGGEMKLACIDGRTQRILEVTELDTFFEIYNSPDEALAGCWKSVG
jgi:anti-anti-sigma factor